MFISATPSVLSTLMMLKLGVRSEGARQLVTDLSTVARPWHGSSVKTRLSMWACHGGWGFHSSLMSRTRSQPWLRQKQLFKADGDTFPLKLLEKEVELRVQAHFLKHTSHPLAHLHHLYFLQCVAGCIFISIQRYEFQVWIEHINVNVIM